MAFHVGQLVECVDDRDRPHPRISGTKWQSELHGLKRGRIYTIRRGSFIDALTGFPCVLLEEIVRECPDDIGGESPFAASRFRPLSDTRIASLRSLLTPIPSRKKEAV